MNMENANNCGDPQFMNMLETCLLAEIEAATNTLKSLESEVKEYKGKVQTQLRVRKDLKEKIKNSEENSLVFSDALIKQDKQVNEISEKMELTKLNLDNDHKVMKLECERYGNILKRYEATWEAYRAKYEEFPLAKERKEARVKLEKLRLDGMVIEYKLDELEKIMKQKEHVSWLRLREKIVEFARAMANNAKLGRTLKELSETIDDHREELKTIDSELVRRMKMKEEERKARALKLLEMPPPKVNFSYVHNICARKQKTGFRDKWARPDENSIDTLSVDTVVLEEMCAAEDSEIRKPVNLRRDPRSKQMAEDPRIVASRPSVAPAQGGTECEEAASEMDEDAEPEAIDALEELEQRTEEEEDQEQVEEAEFRSVRGDKQTEERDGNRVEKIREQEGPLSKRMKLISEDTGKDKAAASPAASLKSSRLERKWSQLAGPSPGPKITKIETVRYASPMTKPAIPNPSSMFTPGHYDFCDNSNISFSISSMAGGNFADLKADQISMYSDRDFCGCSNISPMPRQEVEPAAEGNENLPSTSKPHNFTQFDFGSIMKGNSNRRMF